MRPVYFSFHKVLLFNMLQFLILCPFHFLNIFRYIANITSELSDFSEFSDFFEFSESSEFSDVVLHFLMIFDSFRFSFFCRV